MPTIDDYEDGSVSEYGPDAEIWTTNPHSGSYCMRVVTGPDAMSYPGDGLANYPSDGDTLSVWATADFTQMAFSFGGLNANNQYTVYHANDNLRLYERDNGSLSLIASDPVYPVTEQNDVWNRYEIDWGSDGSITVGIPDETTATITANSTTHTGEGGFGLGFDIGAAAVLIDDAEILGSGGITVGTTQPSGASTATTADTSGSASVSATKPAGAANPYFAHAAFDSGGTQPITVIAEASKNPETEVVVAVIEDENDDGTPDAVGTVSLNDGTGVYQTPAVFSGDATAASYRAEVRLKYAGDSLQFPSVQRVELVLPSGETTTVVATAPSGAATATTADTTGTATATAAPPSGAATATAAETERPTTVGTTRPSGASSTATATGAGTATASASAPSGAATVTAVQTTGARTVSATVPSGASSATTASYVVPLVVSANPPTGESVATSEVVAVGISVERGTQQGHQLSDDIGFGR